jgi:alpha-N-acetylglucosamine transferase
MKQNTTENFVTFFDFGYFPHGVALARSLKRHFTGNFKLHIVCVDDLSFVALTQLALDFVKLHRLSTHETNELLVAKGTRTHGEYCWTLTPFVFDMIFNEDPNINRITYLDSDLWFRGDCSTIFDEFNASKKPVLITKHAYHPDYDQSSTSGVFCVQFITMERDRARQIRETWQRQCLEWCYARVEPGRFGDQKYLDEWPKLYTSDVHILNQESSILGPWNAKRFPYSDAIAWHFHGFRLAENEGNYTGTLNSFYEIPAPTLREVYQPYLAELIEYAEIGSAVMDQHKTAHLNN